MRSFAVKPPRERPPRESPPSRAKTKSASSVSFDRMDTRPPTAVVTMSVKGEAGNPSSYRGNSTSVNIMIILAYLLFVIAVILFFISLGCSDGEGTVYLLILAVFVGFCSLSISDGSKTKTTVEKNITIEVSNYHVYAYRTGKMHQGAFFESDKAFDVQNAKKIVAVTYKDEYGIFGIHNGWEIGKAFVFEGVEETK